MNPNEPSSAAGPAPPGPPHITETAPAADLQSTSDKKQAEISKRLMSLSLRRTGRYLGDLFHLHEDADEEGTVDDIKRSIEFRGANLWALVFAVFIASIGLNTNSAAVIIGAMLISPLMGPIMGMGLALGTNDIELLKRSLRNLGVAVTIAILTSTLYFLITPLDQAQSELLARTRPTIFDVLIAIFGGSIGIIASSRKEKTNAIPGVAIATALMPPLCTAGYGLANGKWSYFFGASYLFFINSVFICITTVIFVRLLRFKKVSFLDEPREKRVRMSLAIFAVLTILPSVYAAWEVVQETLFTTRAQQFISENFQLKDTQIIKTDLQYDRAGSRIQLTLMGEPLRQREQELLLSQLPKYKLYQTELIYRQPSKGSADLAKEFSDLNQNLRVTIVEDLYKKNIEQLENKDKQLDKQESQIKSLEQQILELKAADFPVAQITAEIQIQFPAVRGLALERINRIYRDKSEVVPIAMVYWTKQPEPPVKNQLKKLLSVRLKEPKLQLYNY